MAVQNCYMVKPTDGTPLLDPAVSEGSHYYTYSDVVNFSTYSEIYTKITLPTDIVYTGAGITRNAYISLGIASLGDGVACDMGLCNWGGTGWRLCFGGLAVGNTVIRQDHDIPSGTKTLIMTAKNDKSKDTSTKSYMVLYAKFFGSNGQSLGEDEFTQMVPKHDWNRYYRFVSLLHNGTNSFTDGTRMMGAKFNELSIYNTKTKKYENWGVPTSRIENVWIVGYPNGSLYPYDATSETFNINNQ